ncbi:lysophospholipid acyltransferase family protein [bacterium]|nr:lysophospholipid acyltransferase family protein [bacterium]
MIKPKPANWAEKLFARYLRGSLRRHFHAVRLHGSLPELRNNVPVLLLPNHGTWWDGFFVHVLNRLFLRRRLYVMMLAEQLRQYPFFRKLGAYGFDPDDRADVLTTLRFTRDLLEDDRQACVTIFPQGELTPVERRPLGFRPGAGWLIRRCKRPLNVLPLAMRVDQLGDEYPVVSLSFGEPMFVDAHESISDSDLEAAVEATLDRLTSAVHGNGPALEPVRDLMRGRKSISERIVEIRRLFGMQRNA